MSEDSMIERVARALSEAGAASDWDHAAAAARAAIEAMREPTEAMVDAASAAAQKPTGWHMVYRNIYRAMIDTALKDTPRS
jgi:hypothetical protein